MGFVKGNVVSLSWKGDIQFSLIPRYGTVEVRQRRGEWTESTKREREVRVQVRDSLEAVGLLASLVMRELEIQKVKRMSPREAWVEQTT
jgi:hypothetical protein